MTDWADKAGSLLWHEANDHADMKPWEYCAAALRKAKADGLREAAEIASGLHPEAFEVGQRIRAAIDKLEAGT